MVLPTYPAQLMGVPIPPIFDPLTVVMEGFNEGTSSPLGSNSAPGQFDPNCICDNCCSVSPGVDALNVSTKILPELAAAPAVVPVQLEMIKVRVAFQLASLLLAKRIEWLTPAVKTMVELEVF